MPTPPLGRVRSRAPKGARRVPSPRTILRETRPYGDRENPPFPRANRARWLLRRLRRPDLVDRDVAPFARRTPTALPRPVQLLRREVPTARLLQARPSWFRAVASTNGSGPRRAPVRRSKRRARLRSRPRAQPGL